MNIDPPPDVVLVGGTVLGHELDRACTGVAVRGGRIVAVGGDEVARAAGPRTTVIDVEGRSILPGINDSHLHLQGMIVNRPSLSIDVSPLTVASLDELTRRVAERADQLPAGTWIRGHGWRSGQMDDIAPGHQPDHALLSERVPHHPVALVDFSGHSVLANEAAMRVAGIDPAGGDQRFGVGEAFVRDDGSLTGVFVEAATIAILGAVPPPSAAAVESALAETVADLHRIGITSATDAALNPLAGAGALDGGRVMFDLLRDRAQQIGFRISTLMSFSPVGATDEAATLTGLAAWDEHRFDTDEADPDWFAVRGVKVFADGIPPNRTALVNRPYPDGRCGCLTITGPTEDDQIRSMRAVMRAAHQRGLQIGVHVTGDRGAEVVVDALADVMDNRPTGHRHYLIHGTLAGPSVLARAASLGIGVNVQPTLKLGTGPALEALIGPELAAYQWPLRTMLDAGCMMAASSDSPVTDPDWRVGIDAAVRRVTFTGDVSGPSERIDTTEALAAYTAVGAWQDGRDHDKGRIATGYLADLCVIDGRLATDDSTVTRSAPVALTMVGGKVVHTEL